MRHKLLMLAGVFLLSAFAKAQITFTDASNLLENPNLFGGVALAVVDMNDDKLDDIIRLNNGIGLEIEYQQTDGTFSRSVIGNVGTPWGIVVADVDENGYNDIIVGGAYDGIRLIKANDDGTAFSIETLGGPNIFVQNTNFADINNDGAIDYFACHDDGISSPYRNSGNGTFTYDLDMINAVSAGDSDNSGNYGSIWTDYDNDGDLDLFISKCRLQAADNPNDPRRLNVLYQNDGSNNFTEVADQAGLRPLTQTWATNFEDIDNDGDFDAVMVNHDETSQIYENNGDGTFTDIATETGTRFDDTSWGANWLDGDNNGVLDLYVSGSSDENHETSQSAAFYYNEGDTFTTISENGFEDDLAFSYGNAIGDFNNDGFMDIITLNQAPYNGFLFENKTHELTDNNWLKVRLDGVESNRDGYGATIEIGTTQGTQYRFRASIESYLSQNSDTEVFGLGDATIIDYIQVTWPSGQVDVYNDVDINRTYKIIEGQEVLNVTDFNTKDTFRLFPNPVKDIISLELPIAQTNGELHFYDLLGKKVRSQEITVTQTQISLNTLPSGIYIAVYESDTMHISKKIIKL